MSSEPPGIRFELEGQPDANDPTTRDFGIAVTPFQHIDGKLYVQMDFSRSGMSVSAVMSKEDAHSLVRLIEDYVEDRIPRPPPPNASEALP